MLNFVCNIDKKLYSCITNDIVTDEVVITDAQIQHIKDRHPNDFEKFHRYFRIILKNPDYILCAAKPNTGVILKEIEENGEKLKLILRLQTSTDPYGFKNSIITFQRVQEKRYRRYIRNGIILYRKS